MSKVSVWGGKWSLGCIILSLYVEREDLFPAIFGEDTFTCVFRYGTIPYNSSNHQPDIWGLTKGILQSIYILLLETIPFLVQQNVGLVH
jgi:hypothetical protein